MEKLKKLFAKRKNDLDWTWTKIQKDFIKIIEKLNFKWLNGKIITPKKDGIFFHASIDRDGTLSNVPMFVWLSKESKKIKIWWFYKINII